MVIGNTPEHRFSECFPLVHSSCWQDTEVLSVSKWPGKSENLLKRVENVILSLVTDKDLCPIDRSILHTCITITASIIFSLKKIFSCIFTCKWLIIYYTKHKQDKKFFNFGSLEDLYWTLYDFLLPSPSEGRFWGNKLFILHKLDLQSFSSAFKLSSKISYWKYSISH